MIHLIEVMSVLQPVPDLSQKHRPHVPHDPPFPVVRLCSRAQLVAQQDVPETTVDAIVTLRIDGLDHDGLVAISARVARETNMNIEYSCVRTGVLVLHIQPVQVSEKADVMALVRRVLQEAAVKGKIDFLDIHVDEEGWNKC